MCMSSWFLWKFLVGNYMQHAYFRNLVPTAETWELIPRNDPLNCEISSQAHSTQFNIMFLACLLYLRLGVLADGNFMALQYYPPLKRRWGNYNVLLMCSMETENINMILLTHTINIGTLKLTLWPSECGFVITKLFYPPLWVAFPSL
jgi:hypothetical protein